MISEAELRRVAAISGHDLMIQDLDYCLGCLLYAFSETLRENDALILKGGTCLRKCYFDNYRLSEDIDFTAGDEMSLDSFEDTIRQVIDRAQGIWGIDFGASEPVFTIIEDDYGNKSLKARLYYRGPLRRSGNPRGISITVTLSESLLFPVKRLGLINGLYSDDNVLSDALIHCYDLREVLAEKIRAMFGQRRYVISRDVYDIYFLLKNGIRLVDIKDALPRKFEVKGLAFQGIGRVDLKRRKTDFENDWSRNLLYLLPEPAPVTFDEAWSEIIESIDTRQRL